MRSQQDKAKITVASTVSHTHQYIVELPCVLVHSLPDLQVKVSDVQVDDTHKLNQRLSSRLLQQLIFTSSTNTSSTSRTTISVYWYYYQRKSTDVKL